MWTKPYDNLYLLLISFVPWELCLCVVWWCTPMLCSSLVQNQASSLEFWLRSKKMNFSYSAAMGRCIHNILVWAKCVRCPGALHAQFRWKDWIVFENQHYRTHEHELPASNNEISRATIQISQWNKSQTRNAKQGDKARPQCLTTGGQGHTIFITP